MEAFTQPWVIWSLIGLALMILEFILPGLIVFFFGLGALVVGLVCALVPLELTFQLLLFIATTIASLFTLRRWLKSVFMGDSGLAHRGDEDRNFTGQRVKVVQPVRPPAPGKVELNGALWNATSDQPLEAGDIVEVVSRQSLTLTVRRV